MNKGEKQQTGTSVTDSLFGMALTQMFLGAVFGAGASLAFEAAEQSSAIYTDRRQSRPGALSAAFADSQRAPSAIPAPAFGIWPEPGHRPALRAPSFH